MGDCRNLIRTEIFAPRSYCLLKKFLENPNHCSWKWEAFRRLFATEAGNTRASRLDLFSGRQKE
ncbi:MAG: hypothetical protein DMF73_11955 [Acidobacteria bacterium]|nr:MAG: hypothetical protein DMF73_11955 [Acidobacteriota bacterium]